MTYRFSHKDFGLRSQIKIRPQRTIVRLRIILIWRLAKIFMTKSVETADLMMAGKKYLYVGFICHQSIEKIIKLTMF